MKVQLILKKITKNRIVKKPFKEIAWNFIKFQFAVEVVPRGAFHKMKSLRRGHFS